jgi:hypothetical protein
VMSRFRNNLPKLNPRPLRNLLWWTVTIAMKSPSHPRNPLHNQPKTNQPRLNRQLFLTVMTMKMISDQQLNLLPNLRHSLKQLRRKNC